MKVPTQKQAGKSLDRKLIFLQTSLLGGENMERKCLKRAFSLLGKIIAHFVPQYAYQDHYLD